MTPPKLFISYSWSSPTHEEMVINLATELRESGVDVILDKWDLKEGHDAIAFMEQMVTKSDIKKVAIILDRTYAQKADGRAGGVGTETQIISKEVYEKQDQDKFVAVVTEKDENGNPYLPIYYKSRIYVDLSEPDRYSESFDKLLRWIFDKPLYVKPPIGKEPAFLGDRGQQLSLETGVPFRRCLDALKNSKPHASGALDDFCSVFAINLEKLRLNKPEGEFDDAVIQSIEAFLPFRNEVIQVFTTVAQYSPTSEHIQRLHQLFEDLIPYLDKPSHVTSWTEWDFDNFRFITHEMFLYLLAILIKYDRLEGASDFIKRPYYVGQNTEYGKDPMVSYIIFDQTLRSFRHRCERLNLQRYSLRADLLKERCMGLGLEFRHLMQADFIAFIRREMNSDSVSYRWLPETLVFLGHVQPPFEVFAPSSSKAYFHRAKDLIGIERATDLAPLLKSYAERQIQLPRWGFDSINPSTLLGYDKLATRP